jgi:hypothetical protein
MLLDKKEFNLEDYSFIRSSECRGVMRLGRLLAKRVLREHGITRPPVPTTLAYALFKGDIEFRFVKLNACHGATWQFHDGIVIYINKDDSPYEKRLTLFHEVFHALVMQHIDPERRKQYRRSTFTEVMASVFTARMLMPNEMVVEMWENLQDLDAMVRKFRVPKSLMCVTLKRIGLI